MQKNSYEKIKDQLEEKILNYATDKDRLFIRQSVISLFKLKESKRLEPFIEKVEKLKHTTDKNKTLIELYGIILIESRSSFSSDLSDDAIILFAHYYREYEFMDYDISNCNREVLEEACKKSKSLLGREAYYDIAVNLMKEDPNQDIVKRIKDMDEEEYKELYEKYENGEAIQKMVNEEKDKELGCQLRKAKLL